MPRHEMVGLFHQSWTRSWINEILGFWASEALWSNYPTFSHLLRTMISKQLLKERYFTG